MDDTGFIRVENALLKKPNRRIPCFPLIDAAFASSCSGLSLREVQTTPEKHGEALAGSVEELPVDGVYINLGLGRDQGERINREIYRIDDALTLVIPENDVLSIAATDIMDLRDSRFETAKLFHPGMMEVYREIPRQVTNGYAVVPGVTGTFSQVAFLYGVQNLLIAILDHPEQVLKTLEVRHKVVLDQVDQLCSAGIRFAWIGEGLGSGSLISPEQYKEFVLPFEREIAGRFRSQGVLTLLHICGNTTHALTYIAGSGVDGFDLDYPVDINAAVDALYPEMTIKGNINPCLFLPGRSEELEKACRHTVAVAKKLESFILSTGCLVPRDSTKEAFYTMQASCSLQ